MVAANRNLSIRLSTEGGDKTRRDLEQLGEKGQGALRRIESASKPASKGLLAVNAAGEKGQQAMRGYASRLGVVGDALSGIGPAGLAAAAGIGALVVSAAALVKIAQDSAEVGDKFDKMSGKTGLAVETLSDLSFAADRSGASIDEIAGSLIRLQRRQAAAVGSTSLQAQAFKTMGIEIQNADGTLRGAEELFLDIADAVQRMGESSATTNAATRVLGASSAGLLNLLKGGAEGIRALYEENQRLGGQMSTEFAAAAATYKDRVRDLEGAFDGLKFVVGEALLPALSDAANKMTDLATDKKVHEGLKAYAEFFGAMAESGVAIAGAVARAGTFVKDATEGFHTEEGRLAGRITGGALIGAALGPAGSTAGATGGAVVGILEHLYHRLSLSSSPNGVDATTGADPGDQFVGPRRLATAPASSPAGPQLDHTIVDQLQPVESFADMLDRVETAARETEEPLEGTVRNYAALAQLMKKGAELDRQKIVSVQDLARADLLSQQAKEKVSLLAKGASEKQVKQLSEMHEEEMALLVARQAGIEELQRERAEREKNRRLLAEQTNQLRLLAEQTNQFNQVNSTVAQLNPHLANFSQIAFSLVTGNPFGAVIGGITAGIDLFVGSGDRMDRSLVSYGSTIKSLTQTLTQSTLSMGGAFSEEILSMQREAVDPLLQFFDQVEAEGRSKGSTILEIFNEFIRDVKSQSPPFREFIDSLDIDKGKYADSTSNLSILIGRIFEAFPDSPRLYDVASKIFDVRDAFDDMTEASDAAAKATTKASDAAGRENRLRFDAQEIELRQGFQREFAAAGADPFERAAVFMRLSSSIEELASAEAATLRRSVGVTPSSSAGSSPASADVPVSVGSTSVAAYEDVVKLPGEEGRIHLSWEDAVFIDDKYGVNGRRPQSWADILRVPGSDSRIHVAWEDAVFIDDKYGVGGHRPNSWTDILRVPGSSKRIHVAWEDAVFIDDKYGVGGHRPNSWTDILRVPGSSKRIHVAWEDAVFIDDKYGVGSHRPNSWSDVVSVGRLSQMPPIHRSWADAIDINTANLSDFGINRWSQMVLLSRGAGDISRHERSWADAIDIKAATLDNFGINRWSQMVLLSRGAGDISRHYRSWADAIDINTANLSDFGVRQWSDMVRLERDSQPHYRSWADVIDINTANLSDFGVRQWSDMVRLERDSQPHYRSWADVIDINTANLSDFGINRWSQMVLLSRGAGDISRHERSWADAIDIKAATLDNFGINRWSQMVLLSRGAGDISKHERSWADAIDIKPSLMRVDDLIAFQPARVNARDLISVIGKLSINDIIDTSDFNARVDARVASANSNRDVRDDPLSGLPPEWYWGINR